MGSKQSKRFYPVFSDGVKATTPKMLDKTMRKPPPLILGSTSGYRKELLGRLGLPFTVEPPGTVRHLELKRLTKWK